MFDVIVIGAGVSGLAAANKLVAHGKNVLILEARSRLGGRIHTDRHLGVPVDLGASWAHDLCNGSNGLVELEKYHLKLYPYSSLLAQAKDHVAYDEHGVLLTEARLAELKQFVQSFNATIESLDDNTINIDTLFKAYKCDYLSTEDQLIFKHWLKNLIACWSGGETSDISIAVWQTMLGGGDNAYVTIGYDVLINTLATDLAIKLKSPVTHVDYSNDATIRISASNTTYEAKTLLVTLPIGVLKSGNCHFSPALPAVKKKAINALGNGLLDKAVLHFDRCFWDTKALSIQCLPTKNSPIQIYINYQAIFGKPILVVLFGGLLAQKIENMPTDEAKTLLTMPLKKIYGSAFTSPKEIMITQWNNDPFSQGAYSYLPRGHNHSLFDDLATPIDNRVFFAGEATQKQAYASTHGAYLSGLRAADEILSGNREGSA